MGADAQTVLAVIGGATTVANAVFWGAFLLGKMWSRIERLETKVEDLEKRDR
jgi:hypothetical protein